MVGRSCCRAHQQQLSMQQQADEVAEQLAVIGNRALSDNDLKYANETLLLANQLSDAPTIIESVKKLQQQQEAKRQKERQGQEKRQQQARAAEQDRQQQISQQRVRYQNARDGGKFIEDREHMAHLRKLDPDNMEWKKEQDTLEQTVQLRIEQLYNRGINAYSRGQFEEAAAAWRELLILDPNHKLAQDNLARAERVLQRVEQLQQR